MGVEWINTGGEEYWLGIWRRKHRFDGFNITSCVWWRTPSHRVTHPPPNCSMLISFFVMLINFLTVVGSSLRLLCQQERYFLLFYCFNQKKIMVMFLWVWMELNISRFTTFTHFIHQPVALNLDGTQYLVLHNNSIY